jgi:23S rRNA (guanosine2251-2'-O)-methyltransferase
MQKLSMEALERKTIEGFKHSTKISIVVVLENIRSAYNVGSVLRTADAFLLESVYTVGYTPHPPHKQIDKTALGAEDTVHCQHFTDTAMAIAALKEKGFTIWAVEQTANSQLLHQFQTNTNEKIALVFGNEVAGVEQSTIDLCHGCLEIPQFGTKHSLNISVAAGIVLWELVRTRKPLGG